MTQKIRLCSRMTCQREATCTLTYAYADSTVVIGPLATRVEPHAYDMCAFHAARLTAPRGWEVVRLLDDPEDAPAESAPADDAPGTGRDSGRPRLQGLPRPE